MPGALFSLHGATVEAGGATLLHPLDLDLPAGGVLGLIGHNGSGKSTLLRTLARQMTPSRGSVLFMGRPLPDWTRRDLARHLAFMPQDPAIDGAVTVRDLVEAGRFPWHGTLGRFTARDRAAVDSALARTGVAALADRAMGTLSGGERQRAAIALCLAQEPRCLLLDEPTAALDVRHAVSVLALVRSLARDGIASVVVLHDVNLAARFCDELLALRGGRVLARGTPDALMRPEVLESIYGTRLEVVPHPSGGPPVAVLP